MYASTNYIYIQNLIFSNQNHNLQQVNLILTGYSRVIRKKNHFLHKIAFLRKNRNHRPILFSNHAKTQQYLHLEARCHMFIFHQCGSVVVKQPRFLMSPHHLASLKHVTSLGKGDGRKIFFQIQKKNDDFFASYSHPLPPLAYAFHTWAVRSQTGRDMCTHEYIKRYKGN